MVTMIEKCMTIDDVLMIVSGKSNCDSGVGDSINKRDSNNDGNEYNHND